MSRTFLGLLMSCLLIGAQGTVYAQEAPYNFKIVDIPLRISIAGQERQDIVRFTDINNNGEWIGNDSVGDGFLGDVKHHSDSFLIKKYRGFGFVVNRTQ